MLGAVAKVAGRDRGGSSTGGEPGGDGSEGVESIDAFDNAPGTSEKEKARGAAPQVLAKQEAQQKNSEPEATSQAAGAASEPAQAKDGKTATPGVKPESSGTEKPNTPPRRAGPETGVPPGSD